MHLFNLILDLINVQMTMDIFVFDLRPKLLQQSLVFQGRS